MRSPSTAQIATRLPLRHFMVPRRTTRDMALLTPMTMTPRYSRISGIMADSCSVRGPRSCAAAALARSMPSVLHPMNAGYKPAARMTRII